MVALAPKCSKVGDLYWAQSAEILGDRGAWVTLFLTHCNLVIKCDHLGVDGELLVPIDLIIGAKPPVNM